METPETALTAELRKKIHILERSVVFYKNELGALKTIEYHSYLQRRYPFKTKVPVTPVTFSFKTLFARFIWFIGGYIKPVRSLQIKLRNKKVKSKHFPIRAVVGRHVKVEATSALVELTKY